jgi:hypothetical protein
MGYAGSCWWKQTVGGALGYCASQGWTVVPLAQQWIRDNLGTLWVGAGETIPHVHGPLTVDGIVGPQTLHGLYRVCADNGAPQSVLDQITLDLQSTRGQALSFGTCQALIFVAAGMPNNVPWPQVQTPGNIIPPYFDTVVPRDTTSGMSGQIVCWGINDNFPDILTSALQTSAGANLDQPPPYSDATTPDALGSPDTSAAGNSDDPNATGGSSISTTTALDTSGGTGSSSNTPLVIAGVIVAGVVVTTAIVYGTRHGGRGGSGKRGKRGKSGKRGKRGRKGA